MVQRSKKDKAQDWGTLTEWSPDFAAAAIDRWKAQQERLKSSKLHDRIQRAWRTFYMRGKGGNCDNTTIQDAGNKGEVLRLHVARFGRLVRDHLTLVQQTKTSPDPMAKNSDTESQGQVKIGRGVIEHYRREFDLEGVKYERAMVAELCASSYLHVMWDAGAGEEALAEVPTDAATKAASPAPAPDSDADEKQEGNEPPAKQKDEGEVKGRVRYKGEFVFSVRTPYEYAADRSKNQNRKLPRWTIIQEPANRYDLLAAVAEEAEFAPTRDTEAYAKLEHAIRNAPSWSERLAELEYEADEDEYDDCIPVYYVYYERTRSVPEGRQAIVIDEKNVFMDGPLGEPRTPVFRLSQGEVLFRDGEATTQNHDGLPIMDAIDAQMSVLLSNNANHGLARVLAPREANVDQTALDAGAATVNYDHLDKARNPVPPPVIWNPPANDPQLYQFYQLLGTDLDLVMGGSPVTRGDPEATKNDSGSKVAALFAAAQNVGSSFVAAVLRSEEEFYTFLIESLRVHATVPRVISIAGKSNSFEAMEFVNSDLENIQRVTVAEADPMRDTLPGRIALNEAIEGKTPEQQKQTVAVLQTGRLEPTVDPLEAPRLLMERENEWLLDASIPLEDIPIGCENHADHWRSHELKALDPLVRRNPQLLMRIRQHQQQHVNKLTPGAPGFDPVALALSGQQPLPAPPTNEDPQLQPKAQQQEPANDNAPPKQQPKAQPPGTNAGTPGGAQKPSMPTDPTSGQQLQINAPGTPVAAGG